MNSVPQPSLEELSLNTDETLERAEENAPPRSSDEKIKNHRTKMSASRKEKLMGLVALGLTLREIADSFGVKRQRVWQMLQSNNLHQTWKEQRQEVKIGKIDCQNQLQAERQSLVDLLRQREEVITPHSPWIEVKVWQYRNVRPNNTSRLIPNKSLLKLFETYAAARLEGKKLSVYELGEISGIHFCTAARILREVGLDRMYWSVDKYHPTPQWKKEAIFRGFETPLSTADLAYFLELPPYIIYNNLYYEGYKATGKEPILRGSNKVKAVTYRLASQIYEAQDLGFNPPEINELLDLPLKRVTHVQFCRHEYSPIITKALQKMFPEESINTPYRWKK